jgi:hypothetical protein
MLHTNLWHSVGHLSNLIVATRDTKLAYALHMAHLMDVIKDEGFIVRVDHVFGSLTKILIMHLRNIMQPRLEVV